jgi:hypothetical protein
MKQLFLLHLLLLGQMGFPLVGHAAEALPIWSECTIDSECSEIEGLCEGHIGINKKYLKEMTDWARTARKMTVCPTKKSRPRVLISVQCIHQVGTTHSKCVSLGEGPRPDEDGGLWNHQPNENH